MLTNNRFNRRKHRLAPTIKALRCYLRDQWWRTQPLPQDVAYLRLLDSAPVPMYICTRGGRCQSVDIDWRDQFFWVCTSQKMKFFGTRCHILTTLDQMIDTWLLASGSDEARKPLMPLLEDRQGLGLIGDKGYVSQELDDRLSELGEHLLLALKRKNQQATYSILKSPVLVLCPGILLGSPPRF